MAAEMPTREELEAAVAHAKREIFRANIEDESISFAHAFEVIVASDAATAKAEARLAIYDAVMGMTPDAMWGLSLEFNSAGFKHDERQAALYHALTGGAK